MIVGTSARNSFVNLTKNILTQKNVEIPIAFLLGLLKDSVKYL